MDYRLISKIQWEQNNFFISIFFLTAMVLLLNNFFYKSRFRLNISRPNVYVFEYESHSQRWFSLYNILNIFLRLGTYLLILLSFLSFLQTVRQLDFLSYLHLTVSLFYGILTYFTGKNLMAILFYILPKKRKESNKINIIRVIYETYINFYFFAASFLFYFLPVKTHVFLYLIIVISIVWLVINWLNMIQNMMRHTNMKTYQLFLYLCLSEILPLIILIWWISFQIL